MKNMYTTLKEEEFKERELRYYNNYSLDTLSKCYIYCNESFVIEDGKITKIIPACKELI